MVVVVVVIVDGDDNNDLNRRLVFADSAPNITFFGLPRSGKSSILAVVYRKLAPHESIYIEPTAAPAVLSE